MRWIGALVLLSVLGGTAYVRLAPSDPARWHKRSYPSGLGHIERRGGHLWRGNGDAQDLRRLDEVIRAEPRTRILAGSTDEGMITYVTRSRFFGFPDYTTLGLFDGLIEESDVRYLELHGRLRFGLDDLGVNRARIERWLAAAGQGG